MAKLYLSTSPHKLNNFLLQLYEYSSIYPPIVQVLPIGGDMKGREEEGWDKGRERKKKGEEEETKPN